MERDGYFAFARESWAILEKVVKELTEEDLREFGDNMAAILPVLRNITQPEIMALANNAVSAIQEEPVDEKISTWALIRELGDPKVRRGMARMINLLKALDEQNRPEAIITNCSRRKEMSALESVERNEEGFLVNPSDWNKDLAAEIAREEGISELTEDHWKVIEFSRLRRSSGAAPTLRQITKGAGVPTKQLFTLFLKGPAKKLLRFPAWETRRLCITR